MEAALHGPLGRTVLTSSPLTIGRAPDNQLVITDVKASGRHAEVRPDGQGYCIVDVGSSNGTFVNEQRLERNVPRLLEPNDVIRIGTTRYTYETNALFESAPTVYTPPVASGEPVPVSQPTIAAPPSYQAPMVAPPPPLYALNDLPLAPADPYNAPPPVPAAAAQQPKKRGSLWVTFGSIAAVVVVLALALGVFVYIGRSTPEKTLRAFCTDIQNNNEDAAYQLLSSDAQNQESETVFAASIQRVLTAGGGLQNCTFRVLTNDGTNAGGIMTWTLNATPQPLIFNARLVDENSQWKISLLLLRQG